MKRRNRDPSLLALLAGLILYPLSAVALVLVEGGGSSHVIVLAADAIPAEEFAAEELVSHLEKMSGVHIRIRRDPDPLPRRAILLGFSRHLKTLDLDFDRVSLGKEGYILHTAGDRLVIAGGRPRGTLYGVYALLEDQLGCRWFAPDTTFVPKRESVELPRLNITGKPAFEYREPRMYSGHIWSSWWRRHFVPEYVARTRNSGFLIHRDVHRIDERHGGHFSIPHRGHNLSHLVPPEEYAESHPEFFAIHDGKRTTKETRGELELCLTHPEVVRIAAETMRGWMRQDPDADMFFIGQSDSSNHCQCDRCVAVYREYSANPDAGKYGGLGWGGVAGRNLSFVNQVAQLLEGEFPDNRIGMFAYGSTRNPPVNDLQAHRNVVVWYCPLERCVCHPIDRGPINHDFYGFVSGIRKWRKIAPEVYLYDYYLSKPLGLPADLLTLAQTVRTAKRLGVTGINIDSMKDIQAGFGFCRYWLYAQLLRDPDFDVDSGLREFIDAYYGAAAPAIAAFIRLASDPLMYAPLADDTAKIWARRESAIRERLVNGCHLGYRKLTREAIEQARKLFEKARNATAQDALARAHVDAARMVVQYAMIEGLPGDAPDFEAELDSLLNMAKKLEMPTIQGVRLKEYRQQAEKRRAGAPE